MKSRITMPGSKIFNFAFSLIFLSIVAIFPAHYDIDIPLISYYDRLAYFLISLVVVIGFFEGKITIPKSLLFFLLYLFILATFYSGSDYLYGQYQPDLFIYLRFWLFLVLGYNMVYYNDMTRWIIRLLSFGIVLNLIALFIEPTFLRFYVQDWTLAYKLQIILFPSVFYVFFLDKLTRYQKRVVIFSFLLLFLEQIVFQKRLPLVRFLVYLILIFLFRQYLAVYGRGLILKIKLYFGSLWVFGGLIIILGFGGVQIATYWEATLERFFAAGDIASTYESDARLKIGEIIMTDIEQNEDLILGRGFGGVVFNPYFHLKTEKDVSYRGASEMGIPTILLKGGMVLLIFMIYLVVAALSAFKYIKNSQIALAFWGNIFIWALFVYLEGYLGSGANLNEVLLAFGMGILLRVKKDKMFHESKLTSTTLNA